MDILAGGRMTYSNGRFGDQEETIDEWVGEINVT